MKKKENPYKDNPDYMTFAEAVDMTGKAIETFRKYANKMLIYGERVGRCTYYRREDIEQLCAFFSWGTQELVQRLEILTGGKVTITMPEK